MPARNFNQSKPFNHVTQIGRFQLAKSTKSREVLFGGTFGCGFACAAMLSESSFEKAIKDFTEKGTRISDINWILDKYGIKIQHEPCFQKYRNRFKAGSKTDQRRKYQNEVKRAMLNSDGPLLIAIDSHWLLFDALAADKEKIKDPAKLKAISIDSFINEYLDDSEHRRDQKTNYVLLHKIYRI